MNRLNCFWIVVSLSVLFLLGTSSMNQNMAPAAEAQLIKIQPVGDRNVTGLHIDPSNLSISKNTIVIWMNGVPDREVQVVFENGKICKDVTVNPMRFKLDAKDCFVTTFIPFADTSSLQFPEAGTFNYTVQTEGAKLRSKGKIEVH
jgi:hypothetical protein